MLVRILIVLLVPAVAHAGFGGLIDGGPLFGGPRAFVYEINNEYPVGQEVVLEVYATSDLPGAQEQFLGRTKTKVKPNGSFSILGISDPLPDTRFAWKIKYWFSPRTGEVRAPIEFTARKKFLDKE